MEDEYNKLSKEIEGYLRNLEKKIEDVIKVRGLIKEGNFENEKNNIINNMFQIEDYLRDSCRIINKCLVFHKLNPIEIPKKDKIIEPIKVISKSVFDDKIKKREAPIVKQKEIEFSDKEIKDKPKITTNKKLLTDKITMSPIPQIQSQEEIEDLPLIYPPKQTKPANPIKEEPQKAISASRPRPLQIDPPIQITDHKKTSSIQSMKKEIQIENSNKEMEIYPKSSNINQPYFSHKRSNVPKLNFAYDNSEREISTISNGFIPTSKEKTDKVSLTYQQPYNNFTEEIKKENEEEDNTYENNTNLTLNNLIISNQNENEEELNPIDTASKIKQKATKVSELVVLLNQNEDLFEMLSQLFDTNIIDLLLSEDIDDATIDSIYSAIEEIERLKENDEKE